MNKILTVDIFIRFIKICICKLCKKETLYSTINIIILINVNTFWHKKIKINKYSFRFLIFVVYFLVLLIFVYYGNSQRIP